MPTSALFLKLEHQTRSGSFRLVQFWTEIETEKKYSKYIYNWRVRWCAQCISGCTECYDSCTNFKILVRIQKWPDIIICKCIMSELGRGRWTCLELNASVMRDDWLIKLNIPTHQLDLKMAFGISWRLRGLKVDGNTWPCQQISKQQKFTNKQNQQSINTNKIIHKHQFCFDLIALVNNNTQNRTLSSFNAYQRY